MKLDPILTKACRLARAGKYEASIRTLQPEVNRYHGSYRYYYLLGASCLYSGDTGGALTYFRLANGANRRDVNAILGLAVLYLRRGETDRAVDFYLEVLEIDHKNRIARKAMNIIRKSASTDALSTRLMEEGKITSLYPPIPFAGFYAKEVLALSLTLAIIFAVVYGILVFIRYFPNPLNPRGPREGASEFSLTREERMAPVQIGGSYRYVLSRVQTLELYEEAVSLFTAYRDDAARVRLNRILESNAAEGLKNRARVIVSFLETPGFNNFNKSDNVAFSEVKKDPVLYNGVHVIWRGKAANAATSDTGTTFDFLVGYDDTPNKIWMGTVPVVFNQAIPLNPERPLEVLGRIIPAGPEGPIQLEGVAIHYL